MMLQMMLNRLKVKSPQNYKMINEAMQNNGDPTAILKQMMNNATPEQKQGLLNQAKQYGVPEDILSRIQNLR